MGTYKTELDFGMLLGEVPCVIEYDYTPMQYNRYSGPPELCFPAEVDITDVRIEGITLSLELATMLVGELNSIEQLKIDIIEYEEELIAERYEP